MHRPADSNSNVSFNSLQSWSHHDGAIAILKVWNNNPSHDAPTFIMTQTRRGSIMSSLLRSLPIPQWIQNGRRFGEDKLELDYDRLAV